MCPPSWSFGASSLPWDPHKPYKHDRGFTVNVYRNRSNVAHGHPNRSTSGDAPREVPEARGVQRRVRQICDFKLLSLLFGILFKANFTLAHCVSSFLGTLLVAALIKITHMQNATKNYKNGFKWMILFKRCTFAIAIFLARYICRWSACATWRHFSRNWHFQGTKSCFCQSLKDAVNHYHSDYDPICALQNMYPLNSLIILCCHDWESRYFKQL